MNKVNHMICPRCGHDFYVDCAYATCDGCGVHFYATQSQTCTPPLVSGWTTRWPGQTVTQMPVLK